MRKRIDRLESNLPTRHLAQAAKDLRLLYTVYITVERGHTSLEEEYLSITYEHEDSASDGYFLTIQAPRPGHAHGKQSWSVTIDQWIPDEYDSDGEIAAAHGDTVLECVLAERPTEGDLASLLALAESAPEQMSVWAKASVGDVLAGTAFIVTSRDDSH
jgi:hypothetical protein